MANLRFKIRNIPRRSGHLTGIKIKDAQHFWFAHVQGVVFAREIKTLRNQQPLPHNSELRALNPFIDGKGLLRLGGRLTQFFLSYSLILPFYLDIALTSY